MQFTAFAPQIMNDFMHMDRVKDDVGELLSPIYNADEIISDCLKDRGDGGRSGQFFFFNKDKTFILKTVSRTERDVFL